jgi:hypothetical protein
MTWDVSENWFKENGFADLAADPTLGALGPVSAKPRSAADEQRLDEPGGRPPSQATVLVELAEDVQLFHTAAHESFAVVPVSGHREVWSLKAGAFRRWLQRRYHEATGKAAHAQAVQDAIGVLEGRALFDGPEQNVHVRLAAHEARCTSTWPTSSGGRSR